VAFGSHTRQMVAARLLQMAGGVVAKESDRQAFALKSDENFPGAVGAVVIKDQVMVDPGDGVAHESLDDVGFVFDD